MREKRGQLPLTTEEITGRERAQLLRIEEMISRNRARHETLMQRRHVLWTKLLERGVRKNVIAAASGITHGALNFALKTRAR